SKAIAVATCRPTMNARYEDCSLLCCALSVTRCAHEPPISAGTSTEWPRLETGNSSVTPCSTPIVAACRYVNSDMWLLIGWRGWVLLEPAAETATSDPPAKDS